MIEVGNKVYICSRCEKLCIASEVLWKFAERYYHEPDKKKRRQTFSTQTPRRIQIVLHNVTYQYQAIFDQFHSFPMEHSIVFPLCNNCCNLIIETLVRQRDYYLFEKQNLLNCKLNIQSNVAEKLRKMVTNKQEQVKVLKEVAREQINSQISMKSISTTRQNRFTTVIEPNHQSYLTNKEHAK